MNYNLKVTIKISSILLISGVFFYVYGTFNPVTSGIPFPKCPSYSLLGLVCPGCGSQRAIHELLHLNIKAAFLLNPLLILTLPFVIYLGAVFVFNFIFDKKHQIKILYDPLFTKLILIVVCVYFILRNIPLNALQILNPNKH